MEKEEWVHCPVCYSKTRTKIRANTIAKNIPVFCPKCKETFLADVEKMKVTFKTE